VADIDGTAGPKLGRGAPGIVFLVLVVALAALVLFVGAVFSLTLASANSDAWPFVIWLAIAVVIPGAWVFARRNRAASRSRLIERAAVASLVMQVALVPIAVAMMAM
jgi:hypothetical protein